MNARHLRRLRNGHQIAGYARLENGTLYYSKDLLWWTGVAIAHTERDEYCGYRDLANSPLFANDIVVFKSSAIFARLRYFTIVRTHDNWMLEAVHHAEQLPISALANVKGLRRVSYSFLSPATNPLRTN
jgi:hypothetical protein